MTRFFSAIVLAVLCAVSSAQAEQRKLVLATEGAYAPFNAQTADGKLEGFDIDIGNALCAEMNVTCEWVVQDWDGMIPALKAGKFDAIVASMFITAERKQQIDFTDRYYRTPAAVIVARDSSVAGVAAADLEGKTLGVQGASVYEIYVERFLPGTTAKSYRSVDDMLADLANGRVDAVNDDLIVLDNFLKTEAGACCRLVGTIAPTPDVFGEGAGIAVRKGDMLAGEFNAALKAIRENGKYKEINDRYFSFDIYGDAQ